MHNNLGNGNVPMTPSARVSALNIVGDLLRKVGVSSIIIYFIIPSCKSRELIGQE